jgi:type II secretory pathway pseudopilin PulG
MKLILSMIKAWWNERRRKQQWNERLQLSVLRLQLDEDGRWLGHDPVARALIKRYQQLASDTWEKESIRDIAAFRREIGLDPNVRR